MVPHLYKGLDGEVLTWWLASTFGTLGTSPTSSMLCLLLHAMQYSASRRPLALPKESHICSVRHKLLQLGRHDRAKMQYSCLTHSSIQRPIDARGR